MDAPLTTITTQAGDLARALLAIRDAEDRDEAIAGVLRQLAEASDSDAYTRMHDLAGEITAQVERNREGEADWEFMISETRRMHGDAGVRRLMGG